MINCIHTTYFPGETIKYINREEMCENLYNWKIANILIVMSQWTIESTLNSTCDVSTWKREIGKCISAIHWYAMTKFVVALYQNNAKKSSHWLSNYTETSVVKCLQHLNWPVYFAIVLNWNSSMTEILDVGKSHRWITTNPTPTAYL